MLSASTTQPITTATFDRLGGRRVGAMAGLAGTLLVTALVVCATPARAQFSVRPVIVQLAGDSTNVAAVQVRNQGADELQLRFYAADFDQDENGEHRFLTAGEHPSSCAERLTVFPDGATLRAGETQDIRLGMEPGAETCWSLVFVEAAARAEGGIRIGQRIGVKVYAASTALMPEGHVTDVQVEPTDGDTLRVTVGFENPSASPLRPEGELEIRTFDGDVVERVAIEPFSVLPHHTRRLSLSLASGLEPGRYLAVPILDFGGDYLAGGQGSFEVR